MQSTVFITCFWVQSLEIGSVSVFSIKFCVPMYINDQFSVESEIIFFLNFSILKLLICPGLMRGEYKRTEVNSNICKFQEYLRIPKGMSGIAFSFFFK